MLFSQPLDFERRRGPDLVIPPESLRYYSENYLDGETVFVQATVRNDGDVASGSFDVRLYREAPWVSENELRESRGFGRRKEESLEPGESRVVLRRWDDFRTVGRHRIYIVANADKSIIESEYANNVAAGRAVEIKPPSDLVWAGPLNVSREWANRGDIVRISGVLRNDGEFPMEGAPVEARLYHSTNVDVAGVSEIIHLDLAPGESETVEVELALPDFADTASLAANPGKRKDENNYGNNEISAPIRIPFSADHLRPDGNGALPL